jgi:peroxiredoxin
MKTLLLLLLTAMTGGLFAQSPCFKGEPYLPKMKDTDSGMVFKTGFDQYLDGLIGCDAPDFEMTTMDGKKISLHALRGKIVVLNFWYIHCAGCVREFPALNKLADEYHAKGVEFIAFALDDKPALDSFLIVHPLHYTIVPNAKPVADSYKQIIYPRNMIIGPDLKVRKVFHASLLKTHSLYENYEQIKPYLEAALKEK